MTIRCVCGMIFNSFNPAINHILFKHFEEEQVPYACNRCKERDDILQLRTPQFTSHLVRVYRLPEEPATLAAETEKMYGTHLPWNRHMTDRFLTVNERRPNKRPRLDSDICISWVDLAKIRI